MSDLEVHEMTGTPMRRLARSVQLAVMARPSASVAEAAAAARRRPETADATIAVTSQDRLVAAAA